MSAVRSGRGNTGPSEGLVASQGRKMSARSRRIGWSTFSPLFAYAASTVTVGSSESRQKFARSRLRNSSARNNPKPEVIETLLKAGANAKAKDGEGQTALDYAKDNEKIYKTKVYWKLNELQYE